MYLCVCTVYLSDHPPFLGSPGDKIGKTILIQSSQRQRIYPVARALELPTCPSLPFRVLGRHLEKNVYPSRPGRGFTEYKVHRRRLSSLQLPFWGERRWSVHCKQEEGRTQKCVKSCEPSWTTRPPTVLAGGSSLATTCRYSLLVNFKFFFLSIPIYLSIGIHNRYQSMTTRIFAIDWSSIININRLIDIDWYRLSLIIDSIDWILRDSSTKYPAYSAFR